MSIQCCNNTTICLQVVCQLTSHEMPYTMKAVQMYINGKKYKYACEHKLSTKEEELCSQYLIEKRRYTNLSIG